ncbi:MAG: hypothetical protein V4723_17400 [Pseudomonadota bacterium]
MRDKKDRATLELPGFAASPSLPPAPAPQSRTAAPRKPRLRQDQLELLEPTDASGLPLWRRDDTLDVTGLPIWAAA